MLYILKSPHKKFKNKHHNLQLIITILSKVSMKVHFQKLVEMGSWNAGILMFGSESMSESKDPFFLRNI